MKNLENPIAQNRAEELGYDLWDEFVIPPYYDRLDLQSTKKPRVVIGGRGCGKTMLLRYLCHQTQFSKRRVFDENFVIHDIGVYWKIDTNFAKILAKRGKDQFDWQAAFEHMSVLVICQEMLKSLESIANSSFHNLSQDDLNSINFNNLKDFDGDINTSFNEVRKYLRKKYNQFQLWANNMKKYTEPLFLPKAFISELVNDIIVQYPNLCRATFFIYIDEYENLLLEQQNLINTWIKHSEPPIIFNIAMKREAFGNKGTVGNEQLVSIHDYREYDLESYYDQGSDFNLFAAEILFLRLFDKLKNLPINRDVLRDSSTAAIVSRRNEDYKRNVISYAKNYFPTIGYAEIADEIVNDNVLKKRLISLINSALHSRASKRKAEEFISKKYASASVVSFALLNRRLREDYILDEFAKLKNGKDNKFTNPTGSGWIHNNLVGCILFIYEPIPRPCKFYSGFEAFCKMSKYNIRHLLELCNRSINIDLVNNDQTVYKPIEPDKQAEGAKQASTSLLKEINQFGNNGNALYKFVIRLGLYFAVQQKNPAQSEPEQNHFSIKNGTNNKGLESFISECIKWSVLYEVKITKQKGGNNNPEIEESEYALNPIYAPYFDISYRKKRRTEMLESELLTIIEGSNDEFKDLLTKKSKYLNSLLEETQLSLFELFKRGFNEY